MHTTIDLSDFPEEVTDYAFDQFDSRIEMNADELVEVILVNADADYDEQTFDFSDTIITRVLSNAIHEKIRDIQHEVESGERDDFTLDDVREMQNTLRNTF